MNYRGLALVLSLAVFSGMASAQVMGGQQPGTYPGQTGGHLPGMGEPGLGGSGQAPGVGQSQNTKTKTVDDDTLMRQVHEQLSRSEQFKNITPSVRSGVVTLEGSVQRKEDRKQAEQEVRNLPGVLSVKNKLSVKSQSGEGTGASSQATPSGGTGTTSAESQNNTAGSISGNASAASGTQAGTAAMGQAGASTSSAPSTNPGTTPGSNAGSTTDPGTGTNDQQVSSGVTMSDNDTLRAQIQNAFNGDPNLRNDNISVTVTNDSIELGGTVQSGKQKQAARAIAESYAGNRKVVDRLSTK